MKIFFHIRLLFNALHFRNREIKDLNNWKLFYFICISRVNMYTSIPYSSSDFQCFENIGWHIGHYYKSCIIVYNTTWHDAECSLDSGASSFWDGNIQGYQFRCGVNIFDLYSRRLFISLPIFYNFGTKHTVLTAEIGNKTIQNVVSFQILNFL